MNIIELNARAKINLSLDVTGKRQDGYHNVKMIMQTIALHDKVIIEVIDHGIKMECNYKWVPSDSRNIAFKAADLIINRFALKRGIGIKLVKKIPISAGLAGGSTDAAAVLKGMNVLFSLGMDEEELMTMGKSLGADIPYCIKGGTALAEGIGDILTPLEPFPDTFVVLAKPKTGVSTQWVYKNLRLENIVTRPDTPMLIDAIKHKKAGFVAQNMVNVLETVTATKYSIIGEIKKRMIELGAMGSLMSGSGPTVFGLFPDEETARYAYRRIKSKRWDTFLTQTICEER